METGSLGWIPYQNWVGSILRPYGWFSQGFSKGGTGTTGDGVGHGMAAIHGLFVMLMRSLFWTGIKNILMRGRSPSLDKCTYTRSWQLKWGIIGEWTNCSPLYTDQPKDHPWIIFYAWDSSREYKWAPDTLVLVEYVFSKRENNKTHPVFHCASASVEQWEFVLCFSWMQTYIFVNNVPQTGSLIVGVK